MRWYTVAVRLAVGVASLALLGGCSAGTTPSPSLSPSLASVFTPAVVGSSASPTPRMPGSLAPTTTPSPTPSPTPSLAATGSPNDTLVGRVVRSLADVGLRVRSRPGNGSDSEPYEPLLPLGTQMYVLDGPVLASNHPWYEVVPLSSRHLPSGWVAGAEEDGVPWIAVDAFDCPPLPTDLRSLAALPPGVGLACFPRVPITVEARLLSCDCDVDGSGYDPWWFFLGSGSPDLLVEPGVTSVPEDFGDWFILNLDPAGQHPDVLPVGEVVEVTGVFDHPAAAKCTRTDPPDGETLPSQGCRLEFAVTRLLVQEP
jgi:hypothetical protein